MGRKHTGRTHVGGSFTEMFRRECEENTQPGGDVLETARDALHFFGPVSLKLHNLAALRELVTAFPDGLNSASWAHRSIRNLEGRRE